MFIILSFLMALACGFFAAVFHRQAQGTPWDFTHHIPRWHVPGMVLGVICLVWAAYHGCLMLEGPLTRFHVIVWLLVPVTAILSHFYLDYLFSRAVGGFFVLMANELIRQGFGNAVTFRPLYSLILLLLGVAGLFLIGTPWHFRNLLSLADSNSKVARGLSLALLASAIILILLPIV